MNRTVPQIIRHGHVIKPGIGATLADERLARRLGINGILILSVERNSPAEKAGLKPTTQYRGEIILGDIITAVNDTKVSSYDELRTELEQFGVGVEVILTILRSDSRYDVRVRLAAIN